MEQTTTTTPDADPTAMQPIPGLDALGYGYDVRDQYASATSLKLPIIDVGPATIPQTVDGTEYLVPDNVSVQGHVMNTGTYQETTGKSIEEYRTSLNVNTRMDGRYYYFSGSLQVDFNRDDVQNSEAEFTTTRNVISLWTLGLPAIESLTMLPSAEADIDGTTGMEPLDVLKKYGSHFVMQGVVGGRADYSSATDKMTFTDSSQLTIASQMSYEQAVGSISAENQTKYQSDIDQFNQSSNTKVNTKGGDPALGVAITQGQFNAWADSVSDQPVIIDFTSDSLVPIWELLPAGSPRATALEDAVAEYMSSTSRDIPEITPVVEVSFTDEMIYQGTDHDSGAKKSMKVYKPAISPGYYYSCWKPVPPVGYRALGYIMKMWVHDDDEPSGDMIDGLMCVHESLCVEGQADASSDIWDDHGMNEGTDCSIWMLIKKDEGGVNAGTYYGQNYSSSHVPNPTSPQAYVLDRSKVEIDNPDKEPNTGS